MKYRVVLQPDAEAEIAAAFQFIGDRSAASAEAWLRGLYRLINTLEMFPRRCAIAPETKIVSVEVRQLLFGRGRNKYRIFFTIRGDEIHVLHVRHAARWKP